MNASSVLTHLFHSLDVYLFVLFGSFLVHRSISKTGTFDCLNISSFEGSGRNHFP